MTLQTAACQPPLSSTVSQSLLKFMSIELVMPSDHAMLPARSTMSKFSPPSHETVLLLAPPLQQLSESLLPVSFTTLRAQIRPLQGLIQHFPKCHACSGSPTRFLGKRKRSQDQITVSHSALCFSSLEIHSYQLKKIVWLFYRHYCNILVISDITI